MAVLYGLLNMMDLYGDRVTEVGTDRVSTALDQSVAEHNRQLEAIMALFVRRTTAFKTRYRTSANARLQPLDNNGRALPIKPSGHYDVSFPLQMGGTAWGYDYVTGQKLTVGEVADAAKTMMDADSRWMRDHIMAALFYYSSTNPWTFVDDEHGSLSIYGLANGDSTTYQIMAGADSSATDTHLKGTAALAQATFADIYTELTEHPENSGEVVTFIPTASRATTEAFSGFYPIEDPDIKPAATSAVLTGSLGVSLPGQVIGKIEKNWIVEWRSMPDNYLLSVTTGGEKALAMREDEEPALRGFKKVADRDDHPFYERQYLRRAGFGAWNRVGAVAYRTNNATYVTPTGYASPLA